MPEAALNSFLGRCPACAQLVTLPAEARDREVACPACQHRARGVEFGAIEAPQAVLVVPAAQAATLGTGPRRPEPRAAPARAVPADEARTHLVLDLPCEDDDPSDADGRAADAQTLLVQRIPPRVPAQRARPADEERTHLLLDAAELTEEQDADADGSDQARTRLRTDGRDAASVEEPTRLQIGPLALETGDHSPLSRVVSRLGRLVPALLRLSVWLEEAVHGRTEWALGATALGCGLLAPGLDYLATGSSLNGFTLLFQLSALTSLGVWQLNGLRDDAGSWDPRVALSQLYAAAQLSRESLAAFAASPRHVQWSLVSQVLVLVGLAGLAWASFLDLIYWLWSMPTGFHLLPLLNGLTLLGALLAGRRAQQLAPTPRFSLQELGNSVAAAAALPARINLSDPLPDSIACGTTAVHHCLVALAHWQPREWPSEAAYRAALERHLQRQLASLHVEREYWLGSSRIDGFIDLLVDGMIVIGVQRGVDAAAAQRALGRMRRHARAWAGKPMILALFAGPGEATVEPSTAVAWSELRKECALVSVRMPTY